MTSPPPKNRRFLLYSANNGFANQPELIMDVHDSWMLPRMR